MLPATIVAVVDSPVRIVSPSQLLKEFVVVRV